MKPNKKRILIEMINPKKGFLRTKPPKEIKPVIREFVEKKQYIVLV